jgi:hypothetical protein
MDEAMRTQLRRLFGKAMKRYSGAETASVSARRTNEVPVNR